MIIVLYGPPGTNLDVVSDLLAAKFHCQQISYARIENTEIETGGQMATILSVCREAGRTVSPELVLQMMLPKVSAALEQSDSLLLTGFPRNLLEAKALCGELPRRRQVDLVVDLIIPKEALEANLGASERIVFNRDYQNYLSARSGLQDYYWRTIQQLSFGSPDPEIIAGKIQTVLMQKARDHRQLRELAV